MTLLEHQKRAITSCINSNSKLVIRVPGSGKTLIKYNIVKQLIDNGFAQILLLGPANLLHQYECVFKENGLVNCKIYDHNTDISQGLTITSYDMFRFYPEKILSTKWECVLCDEFHRGKNKKTKTNKILHLLRQKSFRWYAFTGTPFQNTPYEFFELLSLVSNSSLENKLSDCLQYKHPKHKTIWYYIYKFFGGRKKINQGPIVGIKDPYTFKKIVEPIIDYIPIECYRDECHFPRVVNKTVRVNLTNKEIVEYSKLLKTHRKTKDINFFKDEIDDSSIDSRFNQLSDLRQLLLSNNGIPSSKIMAAFNDIKHKIQIDGKRIIVFSNFVKSGLKVFENLLSCNNINSYLYDGQTTQKRRQKILQHFNSDKYAIALMSPVGFEGLDIPTATDILILDPHFNPERQTQLMSRAIRAFSSNGQVEITHYISVSDKIKNGTIDESIERISTRKEKINNLIIECIS